MLHRVTLSDVRLSANVNSFKARRIVLYVARTKPVHASICHTQRCTPLCQCQQLQSRRFVLYVATCIALA